MQFVFPWANITEPSSNSKFTYPLSAAINFYTELTIFTRNAKSEILFQIETLYLLNVQNKILQAEVAESSSSACDLNMTM